MHKLNIFNMRIKKNPENGFDDNRYQRRMAMPQIRVDVIEKIKTDGKTEDSKTRLSSDIYSNFCNTLCMKSYGISRKMGM